ncbi:hypothetical protein U737_00505 [Methylomonas sp. LW13]|nr:hypothetical protein CWO84_15900 [Methylomonas sp. Kb3]QBC25508.1 hypothetical protein U737_00505 [Methylomonas sp. LW13]
MNKMPDCKYFWWVYSEVVLTKRLNIVKVDPMNISKNIYRDVMIGLFFVTGVLSFVSGQFILSTLLFGSASLASNLNQATPARV